MCIIHKCMLGLRGQKETTRTLIGLFGLLCAFYMIVDTSFGKANSLSLFFSFFFFLPQIASFYYKLNQTLHIECTAMPNNTSDSYSHLQLCHNSKCVKPCRQYLNSCRPLWCHCQNAIMRIIYRLVAFLHL